MRELKKKLQEAMDDLSEHMMNGVLGEGWLPPSEDSKSCPNLVLFA